MDTIRWQAWFQYNSSKKYMAIPKHIDLHDLVLARELASILSWFQKGETGEGRIVHQARTSKDPLIDAAFAEAMELYIAEEGRHAKQLGLLSKALGGAPKTKLAAEKLFRNGRRAIGFRHKMLVLTVAEVIGLVSYELIAEATDSTVVKDALEEIASDEREHLDLQAEFFAYVVAESPPSLRALHAAALLSAFSAVLAAGFGMLYLGQRRYFSRAGVSPWAIAKRAFSTCAGAYELAVATHENAKKNRHWQKLASRPIPSLWTS